MSDKKDMNADRKISNMFDELFDSLPEMQTEEEINQFLVEAGYAPDDLEEKGKNFVESLIENNWRFVSDDSIEQEASIFGKAPLRLNKGKTWLIQAIQQYAPSNFQFANRNFEELTEADLALIFQEIEAYWIQEGRELDIN